MAPSVESGRSTSGDSTSRAWGTPASLNAASSVSRRRCGEGGRVGRGCLGVRECGQRRARLARHRPTRQPFAEQLGSGGLRRDPSPADQAVDGGLGRLAPQHCQVALRDHGDEAHPHLAELAQEGRHAGRLGPAVRRQYGRAGLEADRIHLDALDPRVGARVKPPDPAHRQRDGVDRHGPDGAPDRLPEVEARVTEPPADRHGHADVAARVAQQRHGQLSGSPAPTPPAPSLGAARRTWSWLSWTSTRAFRASSRTCPSTRAVTNPWAACHARARTRYGFARAASNPRSSPLRSNSSGPPMGPTRAAQGENRSRSRLPLQIESAPWFPAPSRPLPRAAPGAGDPARTGGRCSDRRRARHPLRP